MIQLDNTCLIGTGRDRACYQHPLDRDLCIKVALKPEKQSKREKRYLRYLQKAGRDLRFVSQYRGEVETNLGRGYVFDLARNKDGQVGLSLKEALETGIVNLQQIQPLLTEFKNYLFNQNICAYDLSPKNLVLNQTSDNQMHIMLVDGLGTPNPNPLATRLPALTRRILDRAWKRLERKLNSCAQTQQTQLKKIKALQRRQVKAVKAKNRKVLLITLLGLFSAISFELIFAEV